MKSLLCKSFTILFLLGTASVLSCYAQITTKVSFTTSSAFVVEKTTLPPGTYMIRPFEDEPDVYELTSSAGHSVIFACKVTGQSATKTELIFHRYGSLLYLKQVFVARRACFVPAGPSEKKAKKSGTPTKEAIAGS
jgi:hypothetical protein